MFYFNTYFDEKYFLFGIIYQAKLYQTTVMVKLFYAKVFQGQTTTQHLILCYRGQLDEQLNWDLYI